jgi:hypothetical protein
MLLGVTERRPFLEAAVQALGDQRIPMVLANEKTLVAAGTSKQINARNGSEGTRCPQSASEVDRSREEMVDQESRRNYRWNHQTQHEVPRSQFVPDFVRA